MKKIKVLQMFLSNNKGGVTQFILNLWNHINRDKYAFDFLTFEHELAFAEELEKNGCIIHKIDCKAEDNKELFLEKIETVLSEYQYDIVHINFGIWKSNIIGECAKGHGIKVVLHAHNAGAGRDVNGEELKISTEMHLKVKENLEEDWADVFCACSDRAAEWMYGKKISHDLIRIIPNGIDLKKFKYNELMRKHIREENSCEEKYIIGCVGRFVYQKNHEFLISVIADLIKENKQVELWLIGVGPLEELIREQVRLLGIENHVVFWGKVDNVNELMNAMDLFVAPSRFEGYAIAFVEAQAMGLPCILGNVTEMSVLSEGTQILELEKNKWVMQIEKQLANPNRYFLGGELLDNISIEKQVNTIECLYDELVGDVVIN